MAPNPVEDSLKSWKEEKGSACLYRILAQKEKGSPEGELFGKLAEEAEKQAGIWERKIPPAMLPNFQTDLRTRAVAFLLKHFQVRHLKMILSAMKVRGLSAYIKFIPPHPVPTQVEEVGRRHQGAKTSGNLRAAVFGINDGLVSNASLILGMAGASNEIWVVLIAGIAGLLAGACSMGSGEYISVKSQREMFEHQIDLEKKELEEYPEQEAAELALIYEAKGLSSEEAQDLSKKLISNPKRALDTLAKEELGINLDELGSPVGAAIFSFISFSIGALIPLLPYLLTQGKKSLFWSIGATACALFVVGATLSLFTGRRAVLSGLRMLLVGGAAAAITYGIGRLLGVTLG